MKSRSVHRYSLISTALALCVVLTLASSRANADCIFDASPGKVTINIFYDDGTDCLDCSEVPTLVLDEDGTVDFNIQVVNKTFGSCSYTATSSDDYFTVGSIFTGVDNCTKGTQSYYWGVYDMATGEGLPIDGALGQPERTMLYGEWLVSSESAGYAPLFQRSGDYEIRRYYDGCGDGITGATDRAYVAVPIEVVVSIPLETSTIVFDDSLGDRSSGLSLFAYAGGCSQNTVHEPVRYMCSDDDPLPSIVPRLGWEMEDCGVEEVTWQKFSGSADLGLWSPLTSVIEPGAEPLGPTLPADELRKYVPSSGSLILRRQDRGSDGDVTYTNELTIVIAGKLKPYVTPTSQDVCTNGAYEDLTASFDESPIGDVRYQWQSRESSSDDFVDLPGETDPTVTPRPRSAEYRVQVWQDSSVVNVATSGTAMSSSQWPDTTAALAIDGNRDGNFYNGSVAHTATGDPAPTWSVDLDRSYRLTEIHLYNREDCCWERLGNVRVSVFDESGAETFREDLVDPNPQRLNNIFIELPEGTRGSAVEIEHLGPADSDFYLQLAEVEVFAHLDCGPYSSDPVTVTVGDSAAVFFPDVDGDGYPDKSGESRLLCEIEDGWAPGSRVADCNDGSALLHPNQRWYFDEDGDGFLARGAEFVEQCSRPEPAAKWILRNPGRPFDCDDTDPAVTGGSMWAEDADRDGYSTGRTVRDCVAPVGFRSINEIIGQGDCDDRDGNEHPGQRWFLDADRDLHGSGPPIESCTRPEGGYLASELATTSDCDDEDALYYKAQRWFRDADGDGYPAATEDGAAADSILSCKPRDAYVFSASDLTSEELDCDDEDPERFPGQRWYPDSDGDGLGRALAEPVIACEPPTAAYASNHRDCDDQDADPDRCAPVPGAGSALRLGAEDATNGLVLSGELESFGRSDFVVEAWIRTGARRGQAIVTRGSPCGDESFWTLGISPDGVVAGIVLVARGNRVELSGSSAVTDGRWHHVLLRRVDDEVSLWVDAVLEASDETTRFVVRARGPVVVGNDLPLDGDECRQGFVGQIDNVRIWVGDGVALRAGPQLHRNVPGDTPGLVVFWSFDKTSTAGPGGEEVLAVDSAQGFPLLLEVGQIVASTAPIGGGAVEATVFVNEGNPVPDIEQPEVGFVVAGAELDGPTGMALTTRAGASPSGAAPAVGAPIAEDYWVFELLGSSTTVTGDVVVEFEAEAITPEMQEEPEQISLYSRPVSSDEEWSFVGTASQVEGTGQIRFPDVTLQSSQLVVTFSGSAPEARFTRGDCNGDDGFDLSDAVFTLGYLFLGGQVPGCREACELNSDGNVDISDAIYSLVYLFVGGSPPAAPFPSCGTDPSSPSSLGCETSMCP